MSERNIMFGKPDRQTLAQASPHVANEMRKPVVRDGVEPVQEDSFVLAASSRVTSCHDQLFAFGRLATGT